MHSCTKPHFPDLVFIYPDKFCISGKGSTSWKQSYVQNKYLLKNTVYRGVNQIHMIQNIHRLTFSTLLDTRTFLSSKQYWYNNKNLMCISYQAFVIESNKSYLCKAEEQADTPRDLQSLVHIFVEIFPARMAGANIGGVGGIVGDCCTRVSTSKPNTTWWRMIVQTALQLKATTANEWKVF